MTVTYRTSTMSIDDVQRYHGNPLGLCFLFSLGLSLANILHPSSSSEFHPSSTASHFHSRKKQFLFFSTPEEIHLHARKNTQKEESERKRKKEKGKKEQNHPLLKTSSFVSPPGAKSVKSCTINDNRSTHNRKRLLVCGNPLGGWIR